jgi:hypothetical protein
MMILHKKIALAVRWREMDVKSESVRERRPTGWPAGTRGGSWGAGYGLCATARCARAWDVKRGHIAIMARIRGGYSSPRRIAAELHLSFGDDFAECIKALMNV